ncbi:hypothetical protein [Bradyrhizobium guangxiense]|uniref:hypothetical protein n=1 Tax=Bradyrhizobium guangxiense TaxID=1325115 RepID=UPI0010087D86|nr:hypothetical protein [Bradyrhizobium guangxiense]
MPSIKGLIGVTFTREPLKATLGLYFGAKPLKREWRLKKDMNMRVIDAAPDNRSRLRRPVLKPNDLRQIATKRMGDFLDCPKWRGTLMLPPTSCVHSVIFRDT